MAFTECLGAKASESINIAAALAILNRELNICPCTEFVPSVFASGDPSCHGCGHHRWEHEAREHRDGGCTLPLPK